MNDHVLRKPLRVAIDAPMTKDGHWGGTEQFVISLVHALGKLDGKEEYVILVHEQNPGWLNSYIGLNQQIIINPFTRVDRMKAWLGPLRKPSGRLFRRVRRAWLGDVPVSNGFYESLGVDVIHFPHHGFVHCNLPTVYTPHDLQHLHYPQFFSTEEITIRDAVIRMGCYNAFAVTVDSEWTKNDLVRQYGITPQKIFAIPMGAPTELYAPVSGEQCVEVIHQFQLPQTFVLYPAQTWQHKNHIRLLEAIALLRDREGIIINLVSTGRKNSFWSQIEKAIYRLNLTKQVRFLGFVRPEELRTLYHLAQFIVHPSLFEGGGLPVLEAFHEKRALACSNAASLPEYAGDAALIFDPTSVESIAQAIARLSTDAELRAELIRRGTIRIQRFTWERTARAYRALYRRAAGLKLSGEEIRLLQPVT